MNSGRQARSCEQQRCWRPCWRRCCCYFVRVSSDAQVLSAQRVLHGTAAAVRRGRQAGGRRSAEPKRPAGPWPHRQNTGERAGGQGQCVFVSLLETTTTAGAVQRGFCKGCAPANAHPQVAAARCVTLFHVLGNSRRWGVMDLSTLASVLECGGRWRVVSLPQWNVAVTSDPQAGMNCASALLHVKSICLTSGKTFKNVVLRNVDMLSDT